MLPSLTANLNISDDTDNTSYVNGFEDEPDNEIDDDYFDSEEESSGHNDIGQEWTPDNNDSDVSITSRIRTRSQTKSNQTNNNNKRLSTFATKLQKSSKATRSTKTTKSTGRARKAKKPKKKKGNNIAKVNHGAVHLDGSPISIAKETIEEMSDDHQMRLFKHQVFDHGYQRVKCSNKREFLQDPSRKENSFNSHDCTYLTKISDSAPKNEPKTKGKTKGKSKVKNKTKASKKSGTKRKLSSPTTDEPPYKKNKTTESATTPADKSIYSVPLDNFNIDFVLFVPPITFCKTMIKYFALPKIFHIRFKKNLHKFRLRTHYNNSHTFLASEKSIRTPYGGLLDFKFTMYNYSSSIGYPDTKHFVSKDQGKKMTATYSCGIHRTVVNLRNYYAGTGDAKVNNYVSFLRKTGLRPLSYYIGCVKYWVLSKIDKNRKSNIFDDMDWVVEIAHFFREFDRCILVQCCLNANIFDDYVKGMDVDGKDGPIYNFSIHCPVVGLHGGYDVALGDKRKVSLLDKLKHFGILKFSFILYTIHFVFNQ